MKTKKNSDSHAYKSRSIIIIRNIVTARGEEKIILFACIEILLIHVRVCTIVVRHGEQRFIYFINACVRKNVTYAVLLLLRYYYYSVCTLLYWFRILHFAPTPLFWTTNGFYCIEYISYSLFAKKKKKNCPRFLVYCILFVNNRNSSHEIKKKIAENACV